MNTKTQPVELRRIPQRGAFKLVGDPDTVYLRGMYRRSEREFLCLDPAEYRHTYMQPDTLVIPQERPR